jgi:hypothetical protein
MTPRICHLLLLENIRNPLRFPEKIKLPSYTINPVGRRGRVTDIGRGTKRFVVVFVEGLIELVA